ncbi:MAG: hypothetical protein IJZ33_02405 [Clostridia bacterium]|nr:hypothetical protein [Clostridia bacterium]
MNKRYGEFKAKDLLTCWIGLSLFGIMGLCSIITSVWGGVLFIIFGFLLIGGGIWSVLTYALQYKERFSLNGDTLKVWRYSSRCEDIRLPNDLIVIVSVADMSTLTSKKIGVVGTDRFTLKGRFAISLLQDISVEKTLTVLHNSNLYWSRMYNKYTNSFIEADFETICPNRFIYSFVGSNELLKELCLGRNCTVIIQESLSNQIETADLNATVLIDKGY